MYTCRRYHRETSYRRAAMEPHRLDWAHQPTVFKRYGTGENFELQDPGDTAPRMSPWQALKASDACQAPDALTGGDLARILSLAYCLTVRSRHPGGDFYYRSVASAGALYPTELYVALPGCRDLPEGLYHYDIAAFRLTRLRSKDPLPEVIERVPAWRQERPAAAFFISSLIALA